MGAPGGKPFRLTRAATHRKDAPDRAAPGPAPARKELR